MIRNFWIEANIDGRATELSGGPRAKDGGAEVTIYQRKEGTIYKAIRISCSSFGDKLLTKIFVDDHIVGNIETKR